MISSADAASVAASAVAASAVATSVAWLLARRHVDVFVLDGGYRAYRLHLRDLLEPGPRVIGVSGRTRSGKTRALRALAAINHQVVDRGLPLHLLGNDGGKRRARGTSSRERSVVLKGATSSTRSVGEGW